MVLSANAAAREPAGGTAPTPGTYTAVIKPSGPWWIGRIEEVPGVNLPGTEPGGIAREARGHAAQGFEIEPSRGPRGRRRDLRRSPDRGM